MNFSIKLLFAIMILPLASTAQKVDEIKARFPGEEAAFLHQSMRYEIKLKDGKPHVESSEKQQVIYLSQNTAVHMTRNGFSHSSFHELKEYEAYTQTAEGKKIKVTDFKVGSSKSESIFYDDVKETSFDFPAISAGAVTTLAVSKVHTDPHLLSPHYFARYVPVLKGELSISFPKDMSIKYIVKGADPERVKFSQDTRRGETTYTFTVTDLAAEKPYGDAPDNSYYALHVVFYIEKYKNENGEMVNYLSNVDDLYRLNYSFIKDINKTISPELKHIVDSITVNANTQEEKARRIYRWVQKSIKYVAFEAGMEGFIPREANLVCSRRFGDCKDMASILTVMLNYAKVPAYYTWIGTRHIPYRYSEIPLPIVDNHMICTIKLGEQYIFLDGTDANCVFGAPSEGIQDKEALLSVNEKEYKILKVQAPSKEKNVLVDSTFLELTDKGIKGSIKLDLSGYYAMNMHTMLSYTSEKDREKYFKDKFNRGSNKFKLEKFTIEDQRDYDRISVTARFDLQDYAKKIADEWYLNLNLFKHYEHEEIDYPKRKMPIEFPFRFVKKYVTVLKIPQDFKVSYMPESKSFKNDTWGFNLTYEQKENQLILTQEFENEHLLLGNEKFQSWNKVLEHLFPAYKETISLSKK